MKTKETTLKLKQNVIDEINRILGLEASDTCIDDAGYTEDNDSIYSFQCIFDDGCQVDFRVCSGNQNFYLDAILYDEDEEDWADIDDRGYIDGDYIFDVDYDDNGNPQKRYVVHIIAKQQAFEVNTLKENGEIATSQTFYNKNDAIEFYNSLDEDKEILINYEDGKQFEELLADVKEQKK